MSELARILWSLRPVLRTRTVEGEPLAMGERRIVPVARTTFFGLGRPGGSLAVGWACTRPVALIDTYRGQARRIPITDPTRRAILAMAGAVLLLALATRYARSRARRAQ